MIEKVELIEQLTAERDDLRKRVAAWEAVGRIATKAIPDPMNTPIVPDWYNGNAYDYASSDIGGISLRARGLLESSPAKAGSALAALRE